MRIAKIIAYVLAGAVLVLILLAVGAVVALSYIDFNRYKPLIADAMREATGRELTISGDLRLDISLAPGIVLDGVTLSNAEWGSRPEMVSVRQLEGEIALASAIFGVVEFSRIQLTGADILLEVDAQGRANFDFSQPGPEAEVPEKPVEGDAVVDLVPLTSELRVLDSRLLYTNAATGATFTADVDSLALRDGGPVTPLTLAYEGSINAAPIRVSAKLRGPAGLIQPGRPWPVELYVDGAANLAVKGSATDPFVGGGLDLAVSVTGDRTGALSELAGMAIPELGAFSLSGRVTGDVISKVHVAGLQAQVGKSDLAGDATLDLAGRPRAVAATLVSRRLELDGLGIGMSATLRDTATSLILNGGMLAVDRFETNLSGARISASGTVADVVKFAGLDLAVSAQGDRVADLSELAGRTLPPLGRYSLAAQVSGDIAATIDITELGAQLGASDVTGGIKISLSGEHPVFDARLRSRAIDLTAFSPLRAPLRDASAVLSLKDKRLSIESFRAKLSGAAVTAEGSIAEPATGAGLDLSVGAKGAQLAELSALAGTELPELGAYSVTGRVNGNLRGTFRVTHIDARVGESDLKGDVAVTLTGDRPLIDADLSSGRIDLVGLGALEPTAKDAAADKPEPKPERLFPDDPLPLEWLKAADVTIRHDAATVVGRQPLMTDAAVALSLNGGRLEVQSVKAVLQNGILDGAARIDGRKEPTDVTARMALRKVDLAVLLTQTAQAGNIQGQVNLEFDLTGRGNSVREIMAGLDGQLLLAMGKGQIRSRTLQTWVGGPTRILSNVLSLNVRGNTRVNCALASFRIKRGLATSDGLLLDTDVAAFVGKGTVNLKTEAVDVIIDPKVKRLTLSAAVPVHIRGTLMRPAYSLDEKAVALRVGGLLGGLVYPPALIIGLGELGTFTDGDCVGMKAPPGDEGMVEQTAPTTEPESRRLPGRILQGTGDSITRGLQRLFGQ